MSLVWLHWMLYFTWALFLGLLIPGLLLWYWVRGNIMQDVSTKEALFTVLFCGCMSTFVSFWINDNYRPRSSEAIFHLIQYYSQYIRFNLQHPDVAIRWSIFFNPSLLEVKDSEGYTLLERAVFYNRFYNSEYNSARIIKTLIACGANIHYKSCDGRTLLHLAASKGCTHVVPYLISNGVEINLENAAGETPLEVAVKAGMGADMIETLLQNGAAPQHVGNDYLKAKQDYYDSFRRARAGSQEELKRRAGTVGSRIVRGADGIYREVRPRP